MGGPAADGIWGVVATFAYYMQHQLGSEWGRMAVEEDGREEGTHVVGQCAENCGELWMRGIHCGACGRGRSGNKGGQCESMPARC